MMILARLMVNHQAQRRQAASAACRWLIILRSLQQTIYEFRSEKLVVNLATKRDLQLKNL
jgi:hypothetical protein